MRYPANEVCVADRQMDKLKAIWLHQFFKPGGGGGINIQIP